MTVVVSGGFDPITPGHIDLFEAAACAGPLIVVLNSDAWLRRKKGFAYQCWEDRARIIAALGMVERVEPVDDTDGTVVEALAKLRPRYFANGGDRGAENTPELDACERLGIKPLFGVGGGKVASSSVIATRSRVERGWGSYEVLADLPWCRVKRLIINPGASSSEQRHALRAETWFTPDLAHRHIPAMAWHRLENPASAPLDLIEVQTGLCREDDIERR